MRRTGREATKGHPTNTTTTSPSPSSSPSPSFTHIEKEKNVSILYLSEGNIRFNSSPANVLVGYQSVGISPSPTNIINEAPCENDVEEMTVIPTSSNCPFPPCFTHTQGSPGRQLLRRFCRFPRFNSLSPSGPQTDRKGGKGEGSLPFFGRPRRLFKCMGRERLTKRYTTFHPGLGFSSVVSAFTIVNKS